MARLARYGGVQPSEFLALDWFVARELADRLSDMDEEEAEARETGATARARAIVRGFGSVFR